MPTMTTPAIPSHVCGYPKRVAVGAAIIMDSQPFTVIACTPAKTEAGVVIRGWFRLSLIRSS